MGDEATARLALPLLAAGQAQKEMTHNEALALLDLAVQPRVAAIGLNDPPADPAPGDCWIVGAAATGDWAGMADHLAGWTTDGWRFVAPVEAMTVWLDDHAMSARFLAGAWVIGTLRGARLLVGGSQVVGEQADAIDDPADGATIDAEARSAVAAILSALRHHGLIAT